MKKIILFLIFMTIPSFAIYVDAGVGVGGASTELDDVTIDDKICTGCSDLAISLGLRIGGQVMDRLWVAGELSGLGHRFYDSSNYMQFNSYLLGPSVIFYPVDHLHLSGSLGIAWTSNDTDLRGIDMYDGTGAAISLTVAYDTGIHDGALIGLKLFSSDVELEKSEKDLSTVGLTFFIAYVHK